MSNQSWPGVSSLVLNEPLLWEKGRPGRVGVSLPESDVPAAPYEAEGMVRTDLNLPDLAELDVVRHYTRLSTWNFGVDTGMYPLGSCTMKYNPKINEKIAALPGFAGAHPLFPSEYSQGALRVLYETEQMLCAVTGLEACSLQPSAGAHGELTGIMLIQAWHRAQGNTRTKMLIPDTAHGTNPASAALCGFSSVKVPLGPDGILTVEDVAALMDDDCAGIMITNPNTLGLFESNIKEIAELVHARGGLVYGDAEALRALADALSRLADEQVEAGAGGERIDHLRHRAVDPLIDLQRGTVRRPRAAVRPLLKTGDRREAAFGQTQDLPHRIPFRRTGQAVASLRSAQAVNKARTVEDGDDLLHIFDRNVLPHGNLFERDAVLPAAQREIEHQPEGIASLCRNFHQNSPLLCAKRRRFAQLPYRVHNPAPADLLFLL